MYRTFLFSSVFITSLLTISCSQPEKLGEKEYIAWFNSEKSPAVQKLEGEQFSYRVKYAPTDYIISLEDVNGIETDYKKRKKQLEKQLFFYFQMQIKKDTLFPTNEAANDKKFEELKKYIRMEAHKDFILQINAKQLSPNIYHMERSVVYNTLTVVMGFDVENEAEDFILKFKNKLAENDELSFEFETDKFPLLVRS